MGDSVTDRGTMYARKLGLYQMKNAAGLANRSPQGSFTNGYVWSDHLAGIIAKSFIINGLRNKRLDASDIADAVISGDRKVKLDIKHYDFLDDKRVKYGDSDFFLSFAEGGLTSFDYKWWPSWNISRFITRLLLSTLKDKRLEFLEYAEKHKLSPQDKAETLILEWSGANDLITVNAEPSIEEVDRAILAKEENILELIKNDFRHFILFNLPDLSLTPYFQAQSAEKRLNAQNCVNYYCRELNKLVAEFQDLYPDCSFHVFDVNKKFTEVYQNPLKYQFEAEKLATPYSTSPDFKMTANGVSPSKGYMFWDGKHPTADVHSIIAAEFFKQFAIKFLFVPPNENSYKLMASLFPARVVTKKQPEAKQAEEKTTSKFTL